MTAPNNKFRNHFIATTALVIYVGILLGNSAARIATSPKTLVDNYPNGKVQNRIEVDEHRQPHGWSREYTDTGTLKAERHYVHGIRDGISRLYYTTGELMTEWIYRNGKRHGTSLGYFKNGRLKDKGVYQNDLLEGPVLKYYPGGALKARMNFKHDLLEGDSFIYFENGQVQSIYRYFKGRAWTLKVYTPDGKLLRKQEFPQPRLQP
jgi:antitoxin component YwqK of YwqJK toxin-antitoxin module